MDAQSQPTGASIAPLAFAIGITVVLVGLIVSPLVIAPLGSAIILAAGSVWAHGNHTTSRHQSVPPARAPRHATGEERLPRSHLLERATLGLGAFALRDPGQPVTGPESLLYPLKPGS